MHQIYHSTNYPIRIQRLLLLGLVCQILWGCPSSGAVHEDGTVNPPDSPIFVEGCVGLTPPDSAWPAVVLPEADSVTDGSDLFTALDAEVVGTEDSVSDDTQTTDDGSVTDAPLSTDAAEDTTRARTTDAATVETVDTSVAPDADSAAGPQDAPATDVQAADVSTDTETNDDGGVTDGVLLADAADTVSSDVYDCSEFPSTCLEAPSPGYELQDFQPQSCGYGAIYGLDLYKQEVSVVVLLAAW